ncbi:MAG: DEAD/DEAH box helicase, partial [Thalassolituus maritimus]
MPTAQSCALRSGILAFFLQRDFSVFAGTELHPRLIAGLEKQSITEATDVQLEVIPEVLRGSDVQVCAETGSGKTFAYLLPIMQKLLTVDAPDSATRALVIVPTRELARQVFKDAK